MKNSRKRSKRVLASALTALFIAQQSMLLSVVASDITGVTNGGHGTFNINPEHASGNVGFRGYENFNLDQGDIANLIYHLNGVDLTTFINLVDNTININGLLNTVNKNGDFTNGKAIFVSPNGMIVGASGVLNVGSLGVYTPNSGYYNSAKRRLEAKTITADEVPTLIKSNGGGEITIDGKILSAGGVDLKGGQITVGQNAGVIGGINPEQMLALTSEKQANDLFNKLVNTDNINSGNKFISNEQGQINITSSKGTDIQGSVINYATGDDSKIYINNTGDNGIKIAGDVVNTKGKLDIHNNKGNLVISGNVKNDGTTRIWNSPYKVYSEVELDNGLTITGNVDTKGTLDIRNSGERGIDISGSIRHDGDAFITNGATPEIVTFGNTMGGLNVSGNIENTGNIVFLNTVDGVDGMNITGVVNAGETATFTNHGQAGLNVLEEGKIAATNVVMENTGEMGVNIDSKARINSTNDTTIINDSVGGVNVKGLVNAQNNVKVLSDNGNVVIGDDTENNNYITAGNNIDITVNKGSILNYGVIKTLLNAGGDLTMTV
ncbi:leukotoxin LktA family filamentous adhesin, partial [bacterium]|nr:leukotoxin LktA family filamentous adhesin [bacterium]